MEIKQKENTMAATWQELAQAATGPCPELFTGTQGHLMARDNDGTSHLETYRAFLKRGSNVRSGFDGHGYALLDNGTGKEIGNFAFRCDALIAQAEYAARRDAPKRPARASKARLLVEAGLASDLKDARAQLADLGL